MTVIHKDLQHNTCCHKHAFEIRNSQSSEYGDENPQRICASRLLPQFRWLRKCGPFYKPGQSSQQEPWRVQDYLCSDWGDFVNGGQLHGPNPGNEVSSEPILTEAPLVFRKS
jgi:hypothetical protein